MRAIQWLAGLAAFSLILAHGTSSTRAQSSPTKLPPPEAPVGEPLLAPPGPGPGPVGAVLPKQIPSAAKPAPADEHDATPGQEPDNPTGRQEPAISLEWIGP